MKKDTSNAELALMSLLAERPMHAYEIAQIIEERGMREWTQIGFSSIYYLLKKMHKAGWLNSEEERSEVGGPSRLVYSLSKPGTAIWGKAVIHSLTNIHRGNNPFLIALSAIPLLEHKDVKIALVSKQEKLEEEAKRLVDKINGFGSNIPTNVEAMFDHTLGQITTTIEWIKRWKDNLK